MLLSHPPPLTIEDSMDISMDQSGWGLLFEKRHMIEDSLYTRHDCMIW